MNKFVGTWELISFEERTADGGAAYPYGRDPAGLLIYDAAGRMSVQVMRRDRPRLPSEKLSEVGGDELKVAVEGFTAFFGGYEVDEARGVIIHHVEGHLMPNSVGKALTRRFEFVDDLLILRPTETRAVTWRRVIAICD